MGSVILTSNIRTDRTGYFVAKRIIDLILAIIFLIATLPVWIIISILIMVDSPGSAFFRQKRVGSRRQRISGQTVWDVQEFTVYKFRTMRKDADQGKHQAYIEAYVRGNEETFQNEHGEDIRK